MLGPNIGQIRQESRRELMARAVADRPAIWVSADARRKWPAADCNFIHDALAVISLLFEIRKTGRVRRGAEDVLGAPGEAIGERSEHDHRS